MILTTLQSRAAAFAGDPDQTRFIGKYPAAINDAQKQFAADSMALFEDEPLSFAAGVSTASLPSDFILEESVILDGLPLNPISRHTLAILYPGTDWTILTGTPAYYMIDPEEAVKKVRVIPIPQSALTGSLRYYPLPADVSLDADVILNASTLMTRFHLGIAAFAAWLLLMGEVQTPEIVTKCRQLERIYQDAVNKAIETYGNTKSEPLRIRPK